MEDELLYSNSDDFMEPHEDTVIVDRIWKMLGATTYEALKGRSIYDLIKEVQNQAAHCADMLSVLKRSVAGLSFDPSCNCYVCDAIRVIAKVEGRTI